MKNFKLDRKISFGPADDFLGSYIDEDLEHIYVHLDEPRRIKEDEDELEIFDYDPSISSHISTATFYKIEEVEYPEGGDYYDKKEKLGKIVFYRAQSFVFQGTFDFFDAHSGDAIVSFENIEDELEPYDTYLEEVFVQKSKRGKGFGKKMVQWIESYAGNKIYFNVPEGENELFGKKWETVPEFYIQSFSKAKLIRQKNNTLVFSKDADL